MDNKFLKNEAILSLLQKLLLLGDNQNENSTDGQFSAPYTPINIKTYSSKNKYFSLSCRLNEQGPVVFRAYFLEIPQKWEIVECRRGKWIDELKKLVDEMTTEHQKDLDDSQYFN